MRSIRNGLLHSGSRSSSSRTPRALCLCLCLALLGLTLAHAQEFGLRDLQGKVIGVDDKPVNEAIVYLQNSRNNDIKTFISTPDGTYRFANLSADTDYTVWAAFKGKKSQSRTVSSFDSRKHVILDLHIK